MRVRMVTVAGEKLGVAYSVCVCRQPELPSLKSAYPVFYWPGWL